MNLVLWGKGSSGAVPFSTLIALLALWFCVSVPLTFVGAYFGFRKRVSIAHFVKIIFLTGNDLIVAGKIIFHFFRHLNIQFEPIKYHVKFPINLFTHNQYPAL